MADMFSFFHSLAQNKQAKAFEFGLKHFTPKVLKLKNAKHRTYLMSYGNLMVS